MKRSELEHLIRAIASPQTHEQADRVPTNHVANAAVADAKAELVARFEPAVARQTAQLKLSM